MTAAQYQRIQDLVELGLLEDALVTLRPLLIVQQHKNEHAVISGRLAILKGMALTISQKEMQERQEEIGKAILNLNDRAFAASKILVTEDKTPIVPITYLSMGAWVFYAAFFSHAERDWKLVQIILPIILGLIILFDHSQRQKSKSSENVAQNLLKNNFSKEDIETLGF